MGRGSRILILLGLSAAIAVSCNEHGPSYNRENMKGTWVVDKYDDEELPMEEWEVHTYDNSNGLEMWSLLSRENGDEVWGSNKVYYEIYCCDVKINGTVSGVDGIVSQVYTEQEYDFATSQDSLVVLRTKKYLINEIEVEDVFKLRSQRRLPSTYSKTDSILGVWQLNFRDLEEMDENYRFSFNSSGTVIIYEEVAENEWIPMSTTDKYYLYGGFRVMNLADNAVFGEAGRTQGVHFRIDYACPKISKMILYSRGHEYILSYVASSM